MVVGRRPTLKPPSGSPATHGRCGDIPSREEYQEGGASRLISTRPTGVTLLEPSAASSRGPPPGTAPGRPRWCAQSGSDLGGWTRRAKVVPAGGPRTARFLPGCPVVLVTTSRRSRAWCSPSADREFLETWRISLLQSRQGTQSGTQRSGHRRFRPDGDGRLALVRHGCRPARTSPQTSRD